jgi:holo-[acyl-carrier protein] synthase
MRILGIGTDIAEIRRFDGKEDLAKRILSAYEYGQYLSSPDPSSFLASRFAVKESYVKASGRKEVDYRDVETRKEEDGKPVLYVKGKRVPSFLSLSHDQVALAVLILIEEEKS